MLCPLNVGNSELALHGAWFDHIFEQSADLATLNKASLGGFGVMIDDWGGAGNRGMIEFHSNFN